MIGRLAVRTVKPVLSDAAWQRLRHLDPRVAGRDRARAQRAELAARRSAEKARKQAAADTAKRAAEQAAERATQQAAAAAAAAERARLAAADLSNKSLTFLAEHFKTDKWGRHRYTPHYERHLGQLKHETFTMLEIGIGGYNRVGQGGASLRMWKNYFPRAEIVGLDIEDKSFVAEDRIQAVQGSQTDPVVLEAIATAAGGSLRVVVDDGSHESEHIVESFRILFPLLADGGLYIIEDTQTAYWEDFRGSPDLADPATSMNMIKGLLDGMNYEEYTDTDYQPSYAELHVVAVHAYHNLVFIEKGTNDEDGGTRSDRALLAATRMADLAAARAAEGARDAGGPGPDSETVRGSDYGVNMSEFASEGSQAAQEEVSDIQTGNSQTGDSQTGDSQTEMLGASTPGDSSLEKDPSDWVSGDDPITESQKSYLDTLARQAGEELPADMTKAEASQHIERLKSETGK